MREDEEWLWRWRRFGWCDVHECTKLILSLRLSIESGGSSAATMRLAHFRNILQSHHLYLPNESNKVAVRGNIFGKCSGI